MPEVLKPCPFCGEEGLLIEDYLSDDPPDDTKVYHVVCGSSCAMTPGIYAEEKAETAITAWNTRAFPSADDLKLLNAIFEYFDDTGDGAPDSSSLARQNLNFSEPLHQLIRRLK